MRDEHFEGDDFKAEANTAKHGIDFPAASLVFDDAFAFDKPDFGNGSLEARRIISEMSRAGV